MKVVINNCHGGFSLSPKAVKRLAELNGKECYFFKHVYHARGKHQLFPCDLEEASKNLLWTAFSVSDPEKFLSGTDEKFHEWTSEQRQEYNRKYYEINLDARPENRSDANLIKVVEELGKEANGDCAQLKVVEIPDDIDYFIEEYDGLEWISEKHRTWS